MAPNRVPPGATGVLPPTDVDLADADPSQGGGHRGILSVGDREVHDLLLQDGPGRAIAGDHGAAGLPVGVEIEGVEVESPPTALGDVLHAAPVGCHEHVGRPVSRPGSAARPLDHQRVAGAGAGGSEGKAAEHQRFDERCAETVRFSKLIKVTAVLAGPTDCVSTAEVLPVKLVSPP